ncbi:MAG: hypothetical protein QM733_03805 [Ilumatobacteraceae bacterium]
MARSSGEYPSAPGFGHELRAALFSSFNWTRVFGDRSYVDALAATVTHEPPMEHLWSPAVEEQYHLVWPFAVGAVALFAARAGRHDDDVAALSTTAAVRRDRRRPPRRRSARRHRRRGRLVTGGRPRRRPPTGAPDGVHLTEATTSEMVGRWLAPGSSTTPSAPNPPNAVSPRHQVRVPRAGRAHASDSHQHHRLG